MAETRTLKCPNCGGPIVFDPGASQVQCEHCGNVFAPEELLRISQTTFGAGEVGAAGASVEPMYGYSCSNCGASVWTDDTTLATYCFYCHSPVIVAPRAVGGFAPDGLIPFRVDKNAVVSAFVKWSRSRVFTPRDFGTKEHLEGLTGVYLPFWRADGSRKYRVTGEGVNSSESRRGDYVTTTRTIYAIDREGVLRAENITSLANDKAAEQLVSGTNPFGQGVVESFNPVYLQGFFAERNNITKEQAAEAFALAIHSHGTEVVSSSVERHYDSTATRVEFGPLELLNWRLLLHPFWLLTYRQNQTTFLYCMNGVTGESFGGLPVSKGRLVLATLLLWLVAATALLLVGYLI